MRAEGDATLLFELLLRQGELRTSLGDADRATAPLEEALAIALARGDPQGRLSALRWLGLAWEGQGQAGEATRLYQELQNLAAAAGDAKHQGWAQVGLAWQDYLAGRSARSAERYRQAIAHFATTDERRGEFWAWNGLGASLAGLGDFPGARDCYARAAGGARRAGDATVEAMAENNLGALAMDLGDPGDAILHFDRARQLEIAGGYAKGAFLPALNISHCEQELGRLDAAAVSLDSLLAASRQAGWPDLEARTLLQQATLAMDRGRPQQAAVHYREALALGERLPPRSGLEARLGLARAIGESDGNAAALAVLQIEDAGAADVEDRVLRLAIAAEAAKHLLALGRPAEALLRLRAVGAEAERLGLNGIRVEALARAAAAHAALGRPDSALVLLRRGAEVWEAERGLPRDAQWREQRGAAAHFLYCELAAALLAPRDGLSEAERRREAFDQLQRFKARTLQERMLGPGMHVGAPDAGWEAANLERLQGETLRKGELLLDLYLGPECSLLIAVTREDCHALLLPAERLIAPRLRSLHALLMRPPDPGRSGAQQRAEAAVLEAAAATLRGQLFGGIEDLLADCHRVILVPDGSLNLLAPAQLDAGGEREWMRVPAAAVLVQLRARRQATRPPGPPRVLAIATAAGEQALPGAQRELETLARSYAGVQARVLADSASAVLAPEGLCGFDLLHLAAHAEVDDQNPWQSALLLGPNRARLSAAEIARSRLDARLAVLAACASASGRVLSGEGVLGLASAFLSAGSPAVIATLWPVDDASTAALMERFYAGLAEGRSAAAALAAAQAALAADPRTAHPFFWAGVVLIGDGEGVLPLAPRSFLARRGGQLIAALAALLLLSIALRPARKRVAHL